MKKQTRILLIIGALSAATAALAAVPIYRVPVVTEATKPVCSAILTIPGAADMVLNLDDAGLQVCLMRGEDAGFADAGHADGGKADVGGAEDAGAPDTGARDVGVRDAQTFRWEPVGP